METQIPNRTAVFSAKSIIPFWLKTPQELLDLVHQIHKESRPKDKAAQQDYCQYQHI